MEAVTHFSRIVARHRRIAVDTSIFIYLFENHPRYAQFAEYLFNSASAHHTELITSVITLSEVLIQPLRKKRPDIGHAYERALRALPHFRLLEIDDQIAKTAAYVRAAYAIMLPDAYQVAAGIHSGATLFCTNDLKLKKVKELSVLCLDDLL